MALQPPQQRVEGVGVHREPESAELLQQPVAIPGLPKQEQAGQHHRAAPQLLEAPGEDVVKAHAVDNSVQHTVLSSNDHCPRTWAACIAKYHVRL